MIAIKLFLPLFLAASFISTAAEKPNVVFLLVDDLGWGDFGCYGAEFNETPNIDKLAKDGMLFSNAYAACGSHTPLPLKPEPKTKPNSKKHAPK